MLTARKYQIAGTEFLKRGKYALWDEPGLGKTLQAINAATCPVLVTAPTYLVEQWGDVIRAQHPEAVVSVATGSRAQRTAALAKRADWYVTNIEMFRTYKMPHCYTLIVDEAHHIRSHKAKQSQQIYLYSTSCKLVFELTATPIMKEVDDLYMQFKLLAPTEFTSYGRFVDTFCKVSQSPWGLKIIGPKNNLLLRALCHRFALRRSYKEVGLELPAFIEHQLKLEMEPEFAKAYMEVKRNYRLTPEITVETAGAMLATLRRLTMCPAKITAIEGIIEDTPTDQPVVIFVWYKDNACAIKQHVPEAVVITGDIPATLRPTLAKQSRLVIATLGSLSEGVDLSAAKTVIFAECDYTPGLMYQANRRILRFTEDPVPVNAYYLLAKGTVDEHVLRAAQRRVSDARLILRDALA